MKMKKYILMWGVIIGFLASPSAHALGSITSIGWNGEYWLISSYSGEYKLVRYDGKTFKEVKLPSKVEDFEDSIIKFYPKDVNYYSGFTPRVLGWFNGHWLLAGTERIARFDGENFTISSFYPPLYKMICGRMYCLIVGDSKPGMAAHRVLIRYNGTDFADLTGQLINVTPYILAVSVGSEDDQWLIASYGWSSDPEGNFTVVNELVKYDGTAFVKASTLPPEFYAYSMGYNGEYWLLSDSQQIMKYGDGYFTNLTDQINVTWGFNKWKNDIQWGSDYWLINMGGHLLKYDGSRFIDVGLREGIKTVDVMAWNGEYWLIGGEKVNDSLVLMKYDGSFFIDLTDEFMRAGQARPPSTPSPPPAGYTEAVFAFLILALIAVLVLIWKAKSKGAILGAVWGLVGLITYVALMALEVKGKILLWAVQIIALPSVIWSEIAYQLGGGGSVYYNPGIVLLSSVGIGAILGFMIEKVYRKFKGLKVVRS